MSNLVRATELTNALRTLLGYLDDFRRATFEDASLKLRLVVNYAQKDPVVRHLAELLRHRVSTEALVERTKDQSFTPPPEGTLDRMAFSFTLLVHLNQRWKFDLRELLTRSAFTGAGIDGRMQDFNAKVTTDLTRSLERVLASLEASHPPDTTVDPDPALRAALATIDDAAPAPAPEPPVAATTPAPGASTPGPAGATTISGVEDPDLLLEVELLALELTKDAPDPARLAELEASLGGAGPALGRLARVTIELGTAFAGLRAAADEDGDDEAGGETSSDEDDEGHDDDEAPKTKARKVAPKAASKPVTKPVAKKSKIKSTVKRKTRST